MSGERARISNSYFRTRCNGRKIHWAMPLAGAPTCTRCARPPCGPVSGLTCTDSMLPSRTHQQAKPCSRASTSRSNSPSGQPMRWACCRSWRAISRGSDWKTVTPSGDMRPSQNG